MPGLGEGFGKLILVGEHAVVHGQPAIAFAVDLRTRVRLRRVDGDTVQIPGDDPRLHRALAAALPGGLSVELDSEVPIGRGMGSSAALAVAAVRALADLEARSLDNDELHARAMLIEQVFHGNPSGLDVAISSRGGVLAYRRGPPPTLEELEPPTWSAVVLDSGSSGDTADQVAGVAARRPGVDPTLEAIGELVVQARSVLHDAHALGPLLTRNHALLRTLGVSTPELDDLVALALEAGACGAKLSGAGGGGVVLALCAQPGRVVEAAERRGVSALVVRPARSGDP